MSKQSQVNIHKLLELTGTTHAQLGKIVGVDKSAVSHWKSGKSTPTIENASKIAQHFGLSISNILDEGGMDYVYKGADGKLHDGRAKSSPRFERVDIEVAMRGMLDEIVKHYDALGGLEPDEIELLDAYRSLGEHGKTMALGMVTALAKSGDYS